MKQLAILTLVFLFSACLASVSWGQHYHSYYSGGAYGCGGYPVVGGPGSTLVFGLGNGYAYNGWGYGYRPYYYPPARVTYYRSSGYPAYSGNFGPIYMGPGSGNGGYGGYYGGYGGNFGGYGGGVYRRW